MVVQAGGRAGLRAGLTGSSGNLADLELVFELHVRRGATLSKPLQRAAERGDVVIKRF